MEQVIGWLFGVLLPFVGIYGVQYRARTRQDRAVDEAVRLLERF